MNQHKGVEDQGFMGSNSCLLACRLESWNPLSKVFFGAIEIAKLETGKFLLENFNHLKNPHPLPPSHLLKVEVRIDIQISHLEEIEVRPSD
jgi:hypothetical protein